MDDTTKDALELDYECCECLGTYQEDIDMGNGAKWVKNVAVDNGFTRSVWRMLLLM